MIKRSRWKPPNCDNQNPEQGIKLQELLVTNASPPIADPLKTTIKEMRFEPIVHEAINKRIKAIKPRPTAGRDPASRSRMSSESVQFSTSWRISSLGSSQSMRA